MRKRLLILFMALSLVSGTVMAQELGITAGLEVGLPDVTGDGDLGLVIMPFVEYDNSFDALDVWAGLYIPMGILGKAQGLNDDSEKVADISVALEFDVGYNLELNAASTLSFGLWGLMELPVTTSDDVALPLEPWIKYNQGMDFGDIYGKIGLPLEFVNTDGDEFYMGLNLTLGWASTFGLGIEVTPHFMFAPSDYVDTYDGLTALFTYEAGPFYGELEAFFPGDFVYGIDLGLLCEYSITDPATVYIGLGFGGIGGGNGDIGIDVTLGFKWNF